MASSIRNFDPEAVASIETAMWRAYYEHNFARLAGLMYRLLKTQFGAGFFRTLQMAYRATAAAIIFRKQENDQAVTAQLTKFYLVVRRSSKEPFDPGRVAEAELRWWHTHRRPKGQSVTLESALAEHMAALYSTSAKDLTGYADARADAMRMRDTSAHKKRVEPDWQAIEAKLFEAYTALKVSTN